MKKSRLIEFLKRYHVPPTPLREKLYSCLASLAAVLILVAGLSLASAELPFSLLVLASMGASTFLLFTVPHSPMSQPWPMFGGHVVSAAAGVACGQWIAYQPLAAACAVALAIFVMHWLRCLHPPSAATAMIAVLGGPEVHAIGWKFCYEVVAINAGILLMLALAINNLIPGRRYPLRHSHHPHHAQFLRQTHSPYTELVEEDFAWALSKMDGIIDITEEDLVDIYEFAVEHAQRRESRANLRA